jgi:hypothetical protein
MKQELEHLVALLANLKRDESDRTKIEIDSEGRVIFRAGMAAGIDGSYYSRTEHMTLDELVEEVKKSTKDETSSRNEKAA